MVKMEEGVRERRKKYVKGMVEGGREKGVYRKNINK